MNALIATPNNPNTDYIVLNNGTGGRLTRTSPDGGVSGGNCRGTGAVDLQSARLVNTQVASAFFSTIGGGRNNTVDGEGGTIGGGLSNSIATGANYSTIGGGDANTGASSYSVIAGGRSNLNAGTYATIGGGFGNKVELGGFSYSSILGGQENAITGTWNTIGGGQTNFTTGQWNFIGGGANNTSQDLYTFLGGGRNNVLEGNDSVIGGGARNSILGPVATGSLSMIAGGSDNTINYAYNSAIGGGGRNFIGTGAIFSVIAGGNTNRIFGFNNAICGGNNNVIGPTGTYVDFNGPDFNFIGGGRENRILGTGPGGLYSVIGGGRNNTITGCQYSTIGGGQNNIAATGSYITIGGGMTNTATVDYSCIPGGYGLVINSTVSTAAACAVGTFNRTSLPVGNTGGALFMVGNGSSNAVRSNALTVYNTGNCFAAGFFASAGADYAEYFEAGPADIPMLRTGVVVSINTDTGYIRPTQTEDFPIGVVRPIGVGVTTVIGNACEEEWQGRYLRAEDGTYIMESVPLEDPPDPPAEEDPVPPEPSTPRTLYVTRPKPNPAYDPTQVYIPRSQRPEWFLVGLMGRVLILPGQPTAPTWIKIRKYNNTYEEWLVR